MMILRIPLSIIIYFLLKKWDKKQNEPKTVPQSFPGAQSY